MLLLCLCLSDLVSKIMWLSDCKKTDKWNHYYWLSRYVQSKIGLLLNDSNWQNDFKNFSNASSESSEMLKNWLLRQERGLNTVLKHTCQKNLYYSNVQYYYVASTAFWLLTWLTRVQLKKSMQYCIDPKGILSISTLDFPSELCRHLDHLYTRFGLSFSCNSNIALRDNEVKSPWLESMPKETAR